MEIATVFGKGPKTEVTASLTIKDFIDVMESSEPGKSYETDDFMVKETPLRLVVYPKGRAEEYRGGVSVYVSNKNQVDVKVKDKIIKDVVTSPMG